MRVYFKNNVRLIFTFVCVAIILSGCKKDPSPPLSPEKALGSFELADDNLQIQLVAAEPLVQDPVAISFDEGGRLWVVEMLGFMSDIDGTGEKGRVGRISVLFDDDDDGQMDRSQIFLDSLVLPRALAVIKGGALVAENIPLWHVQDTDGDFRADTKTLIDSTYGGSGMPEHSANGLWRGMDNWLYNAKSKYRYRNINGEWVKDETEFRGQWGIVHDDAGRLFYNYNWSQLHADLVPPNALQRNINHIPSSGIDHGLTLERKIFPIRSNTAVNRGYVPGTLDGEGRLLEFASACGPLIYRGDILPKDYKGNAFICEPTANLIKRNKITEEGFMLSAQGVYKNREFLASTDERFRPISLASGPDGALYVVDMYKGIIQHGPYMTPYLREVTLERKLDRPIHMGRIWRITSKKKDKEKPIDLSQADSKTLVNLLGHPNGWTRDMAQRLLVEKREPIAYDLEEVIEKGNPLAQLHALWTLEGLGLARPEVLLPALRSEDSKVAQTALRLIIGQDSDHVNVKKEVTEFIEKAYDKAAPRLQMQMVLESSQIDSEIAFDITQKFLSRFGQLPVARDVVMSSLQNRETALLKMLLAESEWKTYDQAKEIFIEMLATAIANKGSEKEVQHMLALTQDKMPENQKWIKNALINGMINSKGANDAGELTLSRKPTLLKSEALPEELLQKLTWPGKPKIEIATNTPKHTVDSEVFAMGRQKYLNLCANCHGTQGEGISRFAPPLKNSEWVTGEDYRLAMILLYGMEGPVTVNGKEYGIPDILPSMPSFSTLQNDDIAAISTYIRNTWGHSQKPLSAGAVGHIRFRTQGQITPWKAAELDTLVFDMDL
jgi:mono/diheme cytochrome c family protein/glucose/arabinose dehydrogenase